EDDDETAATVSPPVRSRDLPFGPLSGETATVLTPDELAGVLKVPKKTVVQLCRRGEIAGARKVGRRWRIPAWSLGKMFAREPEGQDAGLQEVSGQVAGPRVEQRPHQRLDHPGIEEGRGGVRGGQARGDRHPRSRAGTPSRADLLRLLAR